MRTGHPPDRPGQFRREGNRLSLFLRAFETPYTRSDGRQVDVRFRGGRIAWLVDERGRTVRSAVLEPEVLANLYGKRHEERLPITIDEVPERLISAVLAAEDARFYLHGGLDARGIVRAAIANLRTGGIVQGGSTITQQTVKNLFLDHGRTWWRKAREAAISLMLDARYSKPRILEVYLNEVYLGQRGPVAVCGIQAASRHYFGRGVTDLTLGEQALLAGLIRSPGRYDPFRHPERAIARRGQVLEALRRLDWIDDETAAAAAKEPLELSAGHRPEGAAAWIADFVVSDISRTYSRRTLREQGLRIYTTVDGLLQRHAEESLADGLARLERDRPSVARQLNVRRLQGAVIVTRPASGEILAMVGGRDWGATQFNRAVLAKRQPGSCFKPFVFAAAFEAAEGGRRGGLSPGSVLSDEPFSMVSGGKLWQPANYDRSFRGPVTVRHVLEKSLNIPTIRAAQDVGIDRVVELAARCGIRSSLDAVPALALGVGEVTPLELASAYGTFAQGGVRSRPWVVRAVTDSDGVVLEGREMERRRVLDERTAWLVNDVLRGVFVRGTARSAASLGYNGSAAGKTGTTDDTRDAWFVGYTPNLLGLVWVGYDDNASTGLTGASGALPIWVDLMAGEGRSKRLWPAEVPRGLERRRIDPASGELATHACPGPVDEWFIAGTEPVRPCALHGAGG